MVEIKQCPSPAQLLVLKSIPLLPTSVSPQTLQITIILFHHSQAVRRLENNHSTLNLSIKNLSRTPGSSLEAKPLGSFPKTQRNGKCKWSAGKSRQAEAQTASCKHTCAHASKKLPADSHLNANFLRSYVKRTRMAKRHIEKLNVFIMYDLIMCLHRCTL